MKTKLTLTATLLAVSLYCRAQNINQFDANGKKDGKWIVYLDASWKKVPDSTGAVFYRYTYYDHGTNVYPMGPCGGKGYSLEHNTPGKLDFMREILDGEYKWFDAKGRLSSVHILKKGEYVSCKEYFKSGGLNQHFDYTKKCEGQEHGWTVYIYDKKGSLKLAWPTCKDKNGKWPFMRD